MDGDERKALLLAALERAIRKICRRVDAVKGDLRKIDQADELIARATLLSTHAHGSKRGAKELSVDDWSTGERVERVIPLDPAKTAREQADALFHRAKRMKRGRVVAEDRLAKAERTLEALRTLLSEAGTCEDEEQLHSCEQRAILLGALDPPTPVRAVPKESGERLPYRTFRSGEHTILVGRGAKDNDMLTTRVARPQDLFLHVKGTPGAHVIVPLQKGASCPAEVLIDAAHLAAHYSDARGEAVVDIVYVPRRYVRKRRGSPAGSVSLDREKVLVLRVETARLQKLLAAADGPGA